MLNRVFSIVSLLGVAACGGSGSTGPTIVPLSPSGFASKDDSLQTLSTLTLPDQRRIVSEGGEERSLDVQDITLDDFNDDDGELIVTIDGETYTLIADAEDPATLEYEDDDTYVVFFLLFQNSPDAAVATLYAFVDGELNASNVVIGLDTDPTAIGQRNGTAEFEGAVAVTTRTGFDDGFGSGTITLDVDFDDMTLDGDMFVFDRGNNSADVRVPSVAFDIVQTDISGNGFETTLEYDESASLDKLPGTIVSTGITGRFFGSDGTTLGGQIFGEVDNGPDSFATLIEGAYVATE